MPYVDAEKQREYQRVWIANRRAAWLADKSCAKCGSTHGLEVDHVDPKTKLFPIAELWSLAEDNPKRVAELAKCQVLCEDHHKEKTGQEWEPKAPEHGTNARYQSKKWKCRCTPCRIAHAEANARYR